LRMTRNAPVPPKHASLQRHKPSLSAPARRDVAHNTRERGRGLDEH
jgi:hypothetical protein